MYPDLRSNSLGEGLSGSSFWPSFTDIMTVIMMIFLMAFLALFSRNSQLVEELTSALTKSQQVEAVAKLTEEEKSQLEVDLLAERARLASIRVDLAAAEKRLALTQKEADQQRQSAEDEIQRLAVTRNELNEELAASRQQFESTSDALSDAINALSVAKLKTDELNEEHRQMSDELSERQAANDALQGEIDNMRASIAELEQQSAARDAQFSEVELSRNRLVSELSRITGATVEDAESLSDTEIMNRIADYLGTLRSRSADLEQQVASLERNQQSQQSQYQDLKSRYDELVKPARSSAGKRVVEVRYFEENGVKQYRMGNSGAANEVVSNSELESRLAAERDKDPESLYVKVVIPDDSGLSFDEAWRFTNNLLNKYDYYYH